MLFLEHEADMPQVLALFLIGGGPRAELGDDSVKIEQDSGQRTVIRLQDDVLFNSGSARLLASAQRALVSIGEVLGDYPDRPIQIEARRLSPRRRQTS